MGMASVLGSPPPIAVAMTTFSGFGWLLGSVVLGHRVLPQAIAVYHRLASKADSTNEDLYPPWSWIMDGLNSLR